MAQYRDFTFEQGEFVKAKEYTNASAVALAIKNIILSRPGNFPLTPSLGIDIEKYEFEIADSKTLEAIKTDISSQIGRFIPSAENVFVDVRLIDDTNETVVGKGRKILGITVRVSSSGENVETNFLLYHEMDELRIYHEMR